jgi:hypothetical protein
MPGLARIRRTGLAVACAASIFAAGLGSSYYLRFIFSGPTPAEYMARTGPEARFVPAGALKLNGENFSCSKYPSVLNSRFPEYGAAYFGFMIFNPDRFATLTPGLRQFAYAHECGHQYVGYSELAADCFAVKRGLKQGWLGKPAFEEVCAFFHRSQGTALHLPGPQRCQALRRCYENAQ